MRQLFRFNAGTIVFDHEHLSCRQPGNSNLPTLNAIFLSITTQIAND